MFFKFASLLKGYFFRFWAVLATTLLAVILTYPASSDTTKYEYDELGRLIQVDDTDGNDTDYSYDPAGNRTTLDVIPGAGSVPHFTVSDAFSEEGVDLVFTVTLHNGVGGNYSVTFFTSPGSAKAGSDYTAPAQDTLNFDGTNGNSSQTITVFTVADSTREQDNETLFLNLIEVAGEGMVADSRGTGYILTGDSENKPPRGKTTTLTLFNGGSLDVELNGFDPEGFPLIITQILVEPERGTATIIDDQTINFFIGTLPADFVFEYEIQDPFGATGKACVHVVNHFDPGEEGPPIVGPDVSSGLGGAWCGPATGGFEGSPDNTSFSINDTSITEGGDLLFAVTKNGSTSETYSVSYSTADGTANDTDYSPTSGGLTFTPSQISKTVLVSTNVDGISEVSETVLVNLSGSSGSSTIQTSQGTGTIIESGPPPTVFSIGNGSATEGDDITFTVTRTGDTSAAQTIDYAATPGTASDGSDYTLTPDTLSFPIGETSLPIVVTGVEDTVYEGVETFFVDISNQSGGTISNAQGTGTITEDDGAPTFSINDVSVDEGGNLVFTVTKAGSTALNHDVDFATADGTATSADYTANSGTLTFLSTDDTLDIIVVTNPDTTVEGNETVLLDISNASNDAGITDNQGVGTINNEDVSFAITPNEQATEGTPLTFTVNKTGDVLGTYTVDYATTAGTATASVDYTEIPTIPLMTLSFGPTDTSLPIDVVTLQDIDPEGNEDFFVNLSGAAGPGGAIITTAQSTGTILDDDSPQDTAAFRIDDVNVTEGLGLTFTVTKDGIATQDYSVDFATSDGTATLIDLDYSINSGTLTFTALETSKTVTVVTGPDTKFENSETVLVNLTNATTTSPITDDQGVGTIDNDDTAPAFSISDEAEIEGVNLVFTVTKTGSTVFSHDVDFATANGTATLADYTVGSGTLSFLAGEVTKTITVVTTQDVTVESDETLNVTLSGATAGATISDTLGIGTIINDDETPPSFSIDDKTVTEGGTLVFTVTKTGTVNQTYAVDFATANGTATTANNDYTANSGTLTFLGADTTKTMTVVTIQDSTVESNETLFVNLSGATNGSTISDSQGLGTINNDDTAPNQPPTANNDSYLTGFFEGEINFLDVLVNDTDPNGDSLTITSLTNVDPGFNIATIACNSTCIRVSTGRGTFTLTYHISDGRGGTSSAIVTYKGNRDFGFLVIPTTPEEEAAVSDEEGGEEWL